MTSLPPAAPTIATWDVAKLTLVDKFPILGPSPGPMELYVRWVEWVVVGIAGRQAYMHLVTGYIRLPNMGLRQSIFIWR